MTFDSIVSAFRQRSLHVDFVNMILVQDTDEQPISYKGKGYIHQTDDDALTFTLYAFEICNIDFFTSAKKPASFTRDMCLLIPNITGWKL